MPAVLALILTLTAAAPLPFLNKEPKLDGALKDLSPSVDFKMPSTAIAQSSALAVKAAFRKDTVWVGVQVTDDKVLATDEVTLTVFFPGAGVTAHGYTYKFGADGKRASPPEALTPVYSSDAVKAATKTDAKGFGLEIALPPKALPRFQARAQLAFTICVEYADVDAEEGAATTKLNTCTSGDMVGGPTRVPDELRKTVKVVPPADVEGLDNRGAGVVGFAELHYPTWGYTCLLYTSRCV